MKTSTHLLLGHVLARCLPGNGPNKTKWVVLGAVLPDFPLLLVGISSIVQSGFLCACPGWARSFTVLMNSHYFDNPFFVAMHHLLHSPVSLALMAGGLICARRYAGPSDIRAVWFLAGAASHSLVDIGTHSQDGILVFWPFDWTYRFNAGVHQWDMQGAGLWLVLIETVFALSYGGYLAWKTVHPFVSFMQFPDRREPLAG